jgi:hypothetical protein
MDSFLRWFFQQGLYSKKEKIATVEKEPLAFCRSKTKKRKNRSDLLRVNGLGKLFPVVSDPTQHRSLPIQNYLTSLCRGVSALSAPHGGCLCGQTASRRILTSEGKRFPRLQFTSERRIKQRFL